MDVENRNRKRPRVSELLAKIVILNGDGGARCPWCLYHQGLYSIDNFRRHIIAKHPIEAVQVGFGDCKRRRSSSRNTTNKAGIVGFASPEENCVVKEEIDSDELQETSGEGFVIKEEIAEVDDSLPKPTIDPLDEVEQVGDALGETNGIEDEDSCVENDSSNNIDHDTTASESGSKGDRRKPLKFIRKDGSVFRCAIEDKKKCGYFQTRFVKRNFHRHFCNVHREAALRNGFFKTHSEEATSKKPSTDSGQKNITEMVKECVYVEQHVTYCQINSESECTYSQQNFNAQNFARHFRKMHPEKAEERGFFKLVANNQSELVHRDMVFRYTEVTAEGSVHCRIAENCPYVQKKFNASIFERHFHNKHPNEAAEKGFKKGTPGEALTQSLESSRHEPLGPLGNQTFQRMVFECTITNQLGIHCRIDDTYNCSYIQKNTFNLMGYLRHFRTSHTEEARAKGFFRTADEVRPRNFVPTTQIMQHVVETGQDLRCGINPSKPCDFIKENFFPRDFLRHFCIYHTDEAEENGFLVEVNRSPLGVDAESKDVNDGAGPSCMANSFKSEADPADEPFVAYENPRDPNVEDNRNVKQELTTPREDPSTYCRLCFSVTLSLQPIFASQGEDRTMAEQIAACAGINLNVETEPSASVCCECVQKLDDIQRFRLQCHALDEVVRGKFVKKENQLEDDYVEGASEIQIKDELPADMDACEDLIPPDVPIDPSDGKSQSVGQSSVKVPLNPGDDETRAGNCGENLKLAQPMLSHHKDSQRPAVTPPVLIKHKFKCTDCDSVLPNRSEFSTHRQRYHNPDVPPKQKIHCTMPSCTKFFMSLILLRRHLKTFHGLTDPDQLELMSALKDS